LAVNPRGKNKKTGASIRKISDQLLKQYLTFLVNASNKELEFAIGIQADQNLNLQDNKLFEDLGMNGPFGVRYAPTFVNYLLCGNYKRDPHMDGNYVGRDNFLEMFAKLKTKSDIFQMAKDGGVFSKTEYSEEDNRPQYVPMRGTDYDRLINLMTSQRNSIDGRQMIKAISPDDGIFKVLELIRIYNMIKLSAEWQKNISKKKFVMNKNIRGYDRTLSAIDVIFKSYGRETKKFEWAKVLNPDMTALLDDLEKLFKFIKNALNESEDVDRNMTMAREDLRKLKGSVWGHAHSKEYRFARRMNLTTCEVLHAEEEVEQMSHDLRQCRHAKKMIEQKLEKKAELLSSTSELIVLHISAKRSARARS
jgi:hypothetical protein